MGESVKDYPLDVVKIEESHETDSASSDFIRTETSPGCPPQWQSAGAACNGDVKSDNLTTDTVFHKEVKQEPVADHESDINIMSGYYNVAVKQENPFEACDDNPFTNGNSTSSTWTCSIEDSAEFENSNCNTSFENNVKSDNVSDVLTTVSIKEEPCDVDTDIHNDVTSFESQHKTGPGKYVQGFNTDNESGSFPQDGSNVKTEIADGGGEGVADFPDTSMDSEGSQQGHGTKQHLIHQPFSKAEVSSKSLKTTFKNILSGPSVQQHDDNNTRDGGNPFQFPKFGKSFYQQSDVQVDLKTQMMRKPSECSTCGKTFATQSHLKDHIRTHTGERPFECQICGKLYIRQSHLNRHVKAHTREKPFECQTCGKAFSKESLLNRHTRTHTRENAFECQMCGKGFPTHTYLQNHIRTHTGEKPFECAMCGKAYSTNSNLQAHIRYHTMGRPFECPTCSKAFSRQSSLRRHIMTHTGEKPFECLTCGKSFSTQSDRQVHIRTHTGERPFECPTCGKAFAQTSNLQSHIKRHTGEKQYKCTICGKEVTQLSNLIHHMKTHNNVDRSHAVQIKL